MNFEHVAEGHTKVMGPGEDLSPSNILIPPKLRAYTDKLLWRESVFDWADNLRACAAGGDSRAKGAAATMGMTLYRPLEFSKKEMVKKAVRTGELVLTAENEDDKINQKDIVKQVVNLVAKDSSVDRLRRVVRLYKQINACKRKRNETIPHFIERFAGPALQYLNLTSSEQDSSDSQNFGITLLLNAGLSSQTFNNIISNLVSSSKQKDANNTDSLPVSMNRICVIKNLMEAFLSGKFDVDDKKRCGESLNVVKAAINQHNMAHKAENDCYSIGFQDAVTALEEAGLEEKDLQLALDQEPKPEKSAKAYLNSNKEFKKGRKRKREYDEKSNAETKKAEPNNEPSGTPDGKELKNDNPDKKFKRNWKPRNGGTKPFFR